MGLRVSARFRRPLFLIATKRNWFFRVREPKLLIMMKRTGSSRPRIAPASWRIPYRQVRSSILRMARRIEATRRVVEARERFVRTGRIETRQQLRILQGLVPGDGWLVQALTSFHKSVAALQAAHACAADTAEGALELELRTAAGVLDMTQLTAEALALNERLARLAEYHAGHDGFLGAVLPAPLPESAKVCRRRAAAAAAPGPSRRHRRRLLTPAVIVSRITRGRAPPRFFSHAL